MLEQLKKDLRNLNAKRRRCDFLDDAVILEKKIKEVKRKIECEKIKETPLTTFSELIQFIRLEMTFLINKNNHWGSLENVSRETQIFKSAELMGIVDAEFFVERSKFDNIELLKAVGEETIKIKANLQIASLRQLARKNNLRK